MLRERPSADRAPTGIPGLDDVLHGGLPRGKTMLILGGPGSGKTVLGMAFLVNGVAHYEEPGLMVSFEESEASLRANVKSFGWAHEPAMESIVFLDARPADDVIATGAFDLRGVSSIVETLVVRHGTKRLVFDGLDSAFLGSNGLAAARVEIRRIFRWLESLGITAIVTAKPREATNDGTLDDAEFIANSVVQLQVRYHDRLLERLLSVRKIRGTSADTSEHQMLIDSDGVRISRSGIFKEIPALSDRRHSTGVERLDRMLDGGLREGTVALISGLPGTAKTTLAASFLGAGLRAGARALLVAFDEPAQQIVHDVASVTVQLGSYVADGSLVLMSLNARAATAEEHFLHIAALMERHRPTLVAVDPISAFEKAGGVFAADVAAERLANLFKSLGITAVFTAVGISALGEMESTTSKISTIADTWIHVSYAVNRGERNRTLTIVKSRGAAHSNQMRELILSHAGITLADVYAEKGALLLGTARIEHEYEVAADVARREADATVEVARIRAEKEQAAERVRCAERDLVAIDQALQQKILEYEMLQLTTEHDRFAIADRRRADPVETSEE